MILYREEHSRRVLVPRVDFVSAPGTSAPGTYRPGGPTALVTGRCAFAFDRARGRFSLTSLHPGETLESIREHTGFDFELPQDGDGAGVDAVPTTPAPTTADLRLLRGRVAEEVAETYPRFAALIAAV